ncbi:MAG: ribonuclease J, partial [Cyanobacteriota bacterium]|nr:ribonuclease J [Cyanobacteriota bacterium]
LVLLGEGEVAVVGRSMLNVIAHARNLGYIKCPDDLFEPLKSAGRLPDEQVLILTTGSQGEPLAALTRISKNEHRQIKVRSGDTIVFSANPIPGNTLAVVDTIDRLMMQGANVIYGRQHGIHVSGHGAREDHKLMLALTKPKFFIPVHGQHRMLVQHAQMAHQMGIPEENTVIIDNGDIVELTTDSIGTNGKVPSGLQLVDSAGVVHDRVLKERQQLAEDGVMTVSAAVGWDLQLLAQPAIHLRGVVTSVEQSLLQQLAIRAIERVLGNRAQATQSSKGGATGIDWTELRLDIEGTLQRLANRELQSRPLVVFLLQTPPSEEPISKPGRRRRSSAASAVS